jgi:hypothetical protein
MNQSGGGRLLLGWYFDMINGKLLRNEPTSDEFRAPVTRHEVGKSNQHLLWRAPT